MDSFIETLKELSLDDLNVMKQKYELCNACAEKLQAIINEINSR